MTLTVRTDRRLVRAAGGSVRYALVELVAPEALAGTRRAPVNLALVLDRSGSMDGQKIVLARQAIEHALRLLKAEDRFSLVVFDDAIDVVVGSTRASAEAKRLALRTLAAVGARGSTNLAGGWEAGCAQVAAHLEGDAIGRCFVVTDGHANVGEADPERLAQLAADMRRRGVATVTFGIGADFDERTLQRMAEGGRGHFYFVETPQMIPDQLTSELGDSLAIVAREAALVLHLPDGVDSEPVGPHAMAAAGRIVRIELGDLTSGQEMQLVVRLAFPAAAVGGAPIVRFTMAARDDVLGAASCHLTFAVAGHAENDAQRRDRVVDRAVASLYAALARQSALALNREGRFEEARALLGQVARKVASYAGSDLELARIVRELRDDLEAYAAHMDALAAKQRHFASYAAQHSRAADGKTRRRSRP